MITTRVQPLEGSSKSFRIVGFEVEPRSYGQGIEVTGEYEKHKPLYLNQVQFQDPTNPFDKNFDFSYTIRTIVDTEIDWSTRLDHYMKFGN